MKGKGNAAVVLIAVVLSVAVITYFILNIIFSPYWDSVYPSMGYFSFASMRYAESDSETFTKEQACADIDYIISRIERVYPDSIDGVPSNVAAAAERAKSSFGASVTAYELWRGAASVLHYLNDAYCTSVPSFPMNYIVDYSDFVDDGAVLTAINGKSIDDIFNQTKDYLSYDTEAWGKSVIRGLAATREGLKFLDLYADTVIYDYIGSDGKSFSRTYSQGDFYNAAAVQNIETEDFTYSSEILTDSNAAVMTIEKCVYSMEYKQFLYNFFSDVKENNIENIVIDLRSTNSGTSEVLDELLKYVDCKSYRTPGGVWRLGPYLMRWESEENNIINMDTDTIFSGDIYVLTSSDTFGSGALIAEILADNDIAVYVGEPCGNNPDGYGEAVVFQTPNAALSFQISSKKYDRIDESKSGQQFTPDILCIASDALDCALEDIANK